jgi:hypothetical protein
MAQKFRGWDFLKFPMNQYTDCYLNMFWLKSSAKGMYQSGRDSQYPSTH